MQMRLVSGPRESRLAQRLIAVGGRVTVIWLAVAIVAGAGRPLDGARLLGVSVLAAVWLLALRAAYAGAPPALGPVVPATIGATTGLVCAAALNPLLPGLHLSLPTLLGLWLGVLASSIAWEAVLGRTGGKRRVLVIGSSALEDIAAMAARGRPLPFELFGPPGETGPRQLPAGTGAGAPADQPPAAQTAAAVLPVHDLARIVSAQRPDLIVLTDDQSCAAALDDLLEIRHPPFRVAGLTAFYEYAFGCVPLPHLTPLWFMSLLHLRQPSERPSKRIFDIVVAAFGLLLAAPLIAILALLIKATPGPAIYRQVRVGERGRRFTMYKLRSMTCTAERAGEAVWAQERDPRTTRVGRFLRRSHLDELPQLWNVLKGDMSIVGPRPERPEFIEMLEATVPFWSRRLLIRPGLTGWAQVRCGYASDTATSAEKLSYDFWYLRHGNLAVDLAICLRTVLLVLEVLAPRRARTGRRAGVAR